MSRRTATGRMLLLLVCLLLTAAVSAQVRVRGYTKANGTYVAPHYRSEPNSSRFDNYSTKGNTNPYTGQAGTVNPYPTSSYDYPAPSAYAAPAPSANAWQSHDADLDDGTRSPKSLSPDEAEAWDSDSGDE